MTPFQCALIGIVLGLSIFWILYRILFHFFGDKRYIEYEKLDLSDWIIRPEYGGNSGFAEYMRSDERYHRGLSLVLEFEDSKSRKPKYMMLTNGTYISAVGFKISSLKNTFKN